MTKRNSVHTRSIIMLSLLRLKQLLPNREGFSIEEIRVFSGGSPSHIWTCLQTLKEEGKVVSGPKILVSNGPNKKPGRRVAYMLAATLVAGHLK